MLCIVCVSLLTHNKPLLMDNNNPQYMLIGYCYLQLRYIYPQWLSDNSQSQRPNLLQTNHIPMDTPSVNQNLLGSSFQPNIYSVLRMLTQLGSNIQPNMHLYMLLLLSPLLNHIGQHYSLNSLTHLLRSTYLPGTLPDMRNLHWSHSNRH